MLRVILGLWLLWVAYWLISATGNKASVRRESGGQSAYRLLIALGGLMFFVHRWPSAWFYQRFVPESPIVDWLGVSCVAVGLAFTVWARVHLGKNWSGTVTLKKDHMLVRTGPYRWVRHPIYTGLILALVGTALAIGQWRCLFGIVLQTAGIILKLQLEEKWMLEIFGEQYNRYKRQVAALVPGLY